MTSHLQAVDVDISKFFKNSFRCLFVNHVPKYVENIIKKGKKDLKLHKAATIYDQVCFMAVVLNLVPPSVVTNEWLTTNILALYQRLELLAIVQSSNTTIHRALRLIRRMVFKKDRIIAAPTTKEAIRKGEKVLNMMDFDVKRIKWTQAKF